MSGTTVAAAKGWLFDQLPASIADATVLIAYDQPKALVNDLVVVGDVKDGVQFKAARGASAAVLEEDYELEVAIDVYRGGDDFRSTFERAAELVDAVVAPVRTDPTWGGAVNWGLPAGVDFSPQWAGDNKGTRCIAVVTFRCHARI